MFLTARGPEALPALRGLALYDDPCSAEQLRSLRQTQWCRRLNELTLNHSLAEPGSGASALATGASCEWVTLDLEHNGLSAANARTLVFAGALGAVRRLSLRRNNLATVAALLPSPLLDQLERFDLTGNPLSDSAKSVLRARLGERVVLD